MLRFMKLIYLKNISWGLYVVGFFSLLALSEARDDRWQSYPPQQQVLLVGHPLHLRWIIDTLSTGQHATLTLAIQPHGQTQETQLLQARLTTAGHTITEQLYPEKVQLIIDMTEVIVIIQDVQLSDSGVLKIEISFPEDAVLYDDVRVQVFSEPRLLRKPPSQLTQGEGQVVRLEWEISSNTSQPKPESMSITMTTSRGARTPETILRASYNTDIDTWITETPTTTNSFSGRVTLVHDSANNQFSLLLLDLEWYSSGKIVMQTIFKDRICSLNWTCDLLLTQSCQWKSPTLVEIHGVVGTDLHLQLVPDDQSCPGPLTELTMYKVILNKQYDIDHSQDSTSHATVDVLLSEVILRNVSEEDSGNYQLKATLANNTILEHTFFVTIYTAKALQPSLVMSGKKQQNLSLVTPGYLEIHPSRSAPPLNLTVVVLCDSVSVLSSTDRGNQDVTINLAQTAFTELLITADYGFHENLLILKNAKSEDCEESQQPLFIVTTVTVLIILVMCILLVIVWLHTIRKNSRKWKHETENMKSLMVHVNGKKANQRS